MQFVTEKTPSYLKEPPARLEQEQAPEKKKRKKKLRVKHFAQGQWRNSWFMHHTFQALNLQPLGYQVKSLNIKLSLTFCTFAELKCQITLMKTTSSSTHVAPNPSNLFSSVELHFPHMKASERIGILLMSHMNYFYDALTLRFCWFQSLVTIHFHFMEKSSLNILLSIS